MVILLDLLIFYVAISFLLSIVISYIISYILPEVKEVKEMPYGAQWVLIITVFLSWPILIYKGIKRRKVRDYRKDVDAVNDFIDLYNKEVES